MGQKLVSPTHRQTGIGDRARDTSIGESSHRQNVAAVFDRAGTQRGFRHEVYVERIDQDRAYFSDVRVRSPVVDKPYCHSPCEQTARGRRSQTSGSTPSPQKVYLFFAEGRKRCMSNIPLWTATVATPGDFCPNVRVGRGSKRRAGSCRRRFWGAYFARVDGIKPCLHGIVRWSCMVFRSGGSWPFAVVGGWLCGQTAGREEKTRQVGDAAFCVRVKELAKPCDAMDSCGVSPRLVLPPS